MRDAAGHPNASIEVSILAAFHKKEGLKVKIREYAASLSSLCAVCGVMV